MHDNVPDEYAGNPIITMAVDWLHLIGVADREPAVRLLPNWEHYTELSPREIAAVYRRFPPESEMFNGGWISGGMATEDDG